MLTAVISILLTFLLTSLAANKLVQAWQHRNWLKQQRLIDSESRHKAAEATFDELSSLMGKRHYRMLRLAFALRRSEKELTSRRFSEYDEALVSWNDRLSVLYAKLAMYLEWNLTRQLEEVIQKRFASIGSNLERLAHAKLADQQISAKDITAAENELNGLQGEIVSLNKRILAFMDSSRARLYSEPEMSAHNLDSFPTWELFKALFQPRVKRDKII